MLTIYQVSFLFQSNRAYVHINSQHESLRHTTDPAVSSASAGTSGGVGTNTAGTGGPSSRSTGGLTGNTIYRWPNRGFNQVLTGTNYDSMMGGPGSYQMSGRGNNAGTTSQEGNADPMSAQEGDVAMWMHLKVS